MTKSIEAQPKKSLEQIHKETIFYPFQDIIAAQIFPKAHSRRFVVLEKFEEIYEAAKARDAQWLKVVNELREALNSVECDCEISLPVNDFPRDTICHRCQALTKADQMLKEMGIK